MQLGLDGGYKKNESAAVIWLTDTIESSCAIDKSIIPHHVWQAIQDHRRGCVEEQDGEGGECRKYITRRCMCFLARKKY